MTLRRMSWVAVVALSIASCRVRPAGPVDVSTLPPPTTSEVFANATEPDDEMCRPENATYDTRGKVACETFVFAFPSEARVRVELRTELTPLRVSFGTQSAVATPGTPAIIEYQAHRRQDEIRVAAVEPGGYGDYELIVGPKPVVVTVPRPKRPWEQLVARILADRPLDGMDRSEADATRALRDAVRGYEVRPPAIAARLDALEPIAIPVTAGYCYQIAYALGRGAEYSEIAKRRLHVGVTVPDMEEVSARFYGRRTLSNSFCVSTSGEARLAMTVRRVPLDRARNAGEGPIEVTVYQVASWPGLKSEALLRKAIARTTAGHRGLSSFRIDMAAPAPKRVALTRGKCYAAVVRPERGSAWSETVIRWGVGIDLEGEGDSGDYGGGLLLGPGIAGNFGCVMASGNYDVVIRPPPEQTTLGTGHLRVQMYVRNARPGELAQMERDIRLGNQESDRSAAERKRRHCARCRAESSDRSRFEVCVRTGGYDTGECY